MRYFSLPNYPDPDYLQAPGLWPDDDRYPDPIPEGDVAELVEWLADEALNLEAA